MPAQDGMSESALPERPEGQRHMMIWAVSAGVLAVVALVTYAYAQHQRTQADDLAATNRTLNASLTQLQSQLQSVTDRLNQRIEAETQAAAARPAVRQQVESPSPRPAATPARDPRIDQLKSQVAEQEKQLATTREELDKARSDLQDKLDANRDELNGSINRSRDELSGTIGQTRDELNGSIARTHDELMLLEKRGERNYFEFSLNKSKQFQKVGPVSLELRKVDYKHKSYDLAMMVDDYQLQKKNVNLYEPVWISLTDAPESAQLVVNQIDKDKITGYIAAPKYKKSELKQTASAPVPATKSAVQ